MNPLNWPVVLPEIFLLAMACAIAIADLFLTDPARRVTFWLTQGTLAVVALLHLDAFNAGQSAFGMQGMVVFDYAPRYGEAMREMAGWMAAGKLKSREYIVNGLDTFPEALLKLFAGENTGKLVLQVVE